MEGSCTALPGLLLAPRFIQTGGAGGNRDTPVAKGGAFLSPPEKLRMVTMLLFQEKENSDHMVGEDG
ncbi:hypothetical protein CSPX01_02078 [Colletotrichum filicis]|nr:hypothetical protein CSPX01_02078 [Colletotrichum filicis]